eukprot:2913117-Rhodomonas_salina.1
MVVPINCLHSLQCSLSKIPCEVKICCPVLTWVLLLLGSCTTSCPTPALGSMWTRSYATCLHTRCAMCGTDLSCQSCIAMCRATA